MAKWVYMFTEGNATMRNLLGGKGANLAEMTNLDFLYRRDLLITQKLVHSTMKMAERSMTRLWVRSWKLLKMEEITGKKFGDKENPLLVSVRSGARASMPGMMDTILNLGLNETL